jgi:hypothetical protein
MLVYIKRISGRRQSNPQNEKVERERERERKKKKWKDLDIIMGRLVPPSCCCHATHS